MLVMIGKDKEESFVREEPVETDQDPTSKLTDE
jgi:hypothetical protein